MPRLGCHVASKESVRGYLTDSLVVWEKSAGNSGRVDRRDFDIPMACDLKSVD